MTTKIEQLNAYLYQQTSILNSLPVAVSIKDSELNYRFFNTTALKHAGLSHTDIYEQSDYDMPWHDQANIFRHGGKKVLSGMDLLTLDPITHKDNSHVTYLTQQSPILNADRDIIGICLMTQIIAHHKIVKNSRYVTEQDKQDYATIIRPHLPEQHTLPYNLTLNEQITLYYLLRGYTLEKIATTLVRSQYTIKDRVETLKARFACQTKPELIKKAIELGYMNHVPKSIAT